jgi:hypothetical protein
MSQEMYQISVKGQLDSSRPAWFEGWTITQIEDGTTLLTGWLADQSELHGMFLKLRNLNLEILTVNSIETDLKEG